jgi:hypothetical protein
MSTTTTSDTQLARALRPLADHPLAAQVLRQLDATGGEGSDDLEKAFWKCDAIRKAEDMPANVREEAAQAQRLVGDALAARRSPTGLAAAEAARDRGE